MDNERQKCKKLEQKLVSVVMEDELEQEREKSKALEEKSKELEDKAKKLEQKLAAITAAMAL